MKAFIKQILGDNNQATYTAVLIANKKLWLSNHDLAHIEVSKLDPIYIDGNLVNGINGIPIANFGRKGEQSLYSAYLDECRVAVHQWCMNPVKPIYIARLFYWMGWLLIKGNNPIQVVFSHIKSIEGK